MCTYLIKRGATFYFRRVIPAELRPAFDGATEFTFSLRTKDREEAKRRRSVEALRIDALVDAARGQLEGPGRAQATAAAPHHGISERAVEQLESEARSDAERKANYAARAPLRRRLRNAMQLSTAEITPGEAATRDLLREQRYEFTVAAERLASRQVRAAEKRRGTLYSDPQDHPGESPQAISATALQPPEAAHAGAMLDTTIIDLWAAERKVSAKGKDTHRAVARWFYDRVGSKPVAAITRKDVLAFKDALVAEGQGLANINMKLTRLRTLLQWAADNDYAASNVAAGIKIKDTDAAKNKRTEFDPASLRAIFSSPVFSAGERPAGGRGEAAYWLPLLALFTGARLEELGQLRPSDIVEERYPDGAGVEQAVWIIRISEDADAGLTLKNAESERVVPVHPELERLGFIRYVRAAQARGDARLFPLLKANIYGRLTAKWGEWFGPYLRTVCLVTDKRMVFHSFRHTFKHYARHANINEGVQRQLMGHSSGDAADAYGSGHSLHRLVEGMRSFVIPGLALPAPAAPALEPA